MNDGDKTITVETSFWKCLQKMERYAGYWESLNKQEKEIRVVCDLLTAIFQRDECAWIREIQEIRSGPVANEPPDVVVTINGGSRMAFEVTELVEQSMIERHKRGQATGKDWKPDEVIDRLQSKLDEKGKRSFSKADYNSVFLVIHTAERQLRPSAFGSVIAAHRFSRRGQINEAYLIFPPGPPRLLYQPEQRISPYIRLSF
ncbi:MAG: hypothetical protein ACLPRE_09180 [Limisphaerales bacterium]